MDQYYLHQPSALANNQSFNQLLISSSTEKSQCFAQPRAITIVS